MQALLSAKNRGLLTSRKRLGDCIGGSADLLLPEPLPGRHRIRIRLILVCLAIMLAGAAQADSSNEVLAAEAEGRFLEAAQLGAALGTAAGHARAAQALAIYGFYLARETDQATFFRQAMVHGERAIEIDPSYPDGHLQFAHATGRYAQSVGTMESLRDGYGGRVRDAIERAIELDPDMAEAHLSLGAWHANVVHQAGGLLGRAMFGATKKKALEHLERAIALAPEYKVVNYEAGIALLQLGFSQRARDLLVKAVDAPVRNALDRIVHGLAAERLAALDAG